MSAPLSIARISKPAVEADVLFDTVPEFVEAALEAEILASFDEGLDESGLLARFVFVDGSVLEYRPSLGVYLASEPVS